MNGGDKLDGSSKFSANVNQSGEQISKYPTHLIVSWLINWLTVVNWQFTLNLSKAYMEVVCVPCGIVDIVNKLPATWGEGIWYCSRLWSQIGGNN